MKLLFDFFPVLLFFIAYKLYGIYVATAVAIAASFVQVSVHWLKHRKFERMHLITLAIIGVSGGLTLWLQNPMFIMWKPTLVNWLFGLVLIGSMFIGQKPVLQRMMESAITLPSPVWMRMNLAWAGFFTTMGALNLYVAYNFNEETWVDFKLFGMLGLTILFVIIQGFYMARHLPDEEKAKLEDKANAEEQA